MFKRLILAVFLLTVCIFVGCTIAMPIQEPSGDAPAAPVNLTGEMISPENVADMIGLNRAEVLNLLGITEADMIIDTDFTSVSVTYEYAGVTFNELLLHFAREGDAPHCDRLTGFTYRMHYAGVPETAAADAITVGTQLLTLHGESLDKTESQKPMIADLSKEAIVQEIANNSQGWSNADFWDMTTDAAGNIKDYMAVCPNVIIESPRGPEYNVVHKQHYYLDLSITHFPAVDTTTLSLFYGLDTYRSVGAMLPGEGSATPSTID